MQVELRSTGRDGASRVTDPTSAANVPRSRDPRVPAKRPPCGRPARGPLASEVLT